MDKITFIFYGLAALAVGIFIFRPRRSEALEEAEPEMPSPQMPLAIASPNAPRGIRNNNPGNLEYVERIQWRGQIGSDGRYAVFDKPENGIRAMLLEIYDAIERDRDNTIRALISVWAPSSENNTAAYITSVSRQTNISPDSILFYRSHAIPIAKAITRHENGYNPYTEQQFLDAYIAAGKYV